MKEIAESYKKKDYCVAGSMRDCCKMAGANKLYFVCRHIRHCWRDAPGDYNSHHQANAETYPCFVEAVIEFKRHLRNYFANFEGKESKADPSDEKTYHHKDFRLVKDPETSIVYCCK